MDFPGYDFAINHGYSLSYSSGKKASYYKETLGLHLEIWENDYGKLEGKFVKIIGLITCTLGPISLPHNNFNKFETQLYNINEYN